MSKGTRIKKHLSNDERNDVNRYARQIKDDLFDIAYLNADLARSHEYHNPDEHIFNIQEAIAEKWEAVFEKEEMIIELAILNDIRKRKQNGHIKQKDYHRIRRGRPV